MVSIQEGLRLSLFKFYCRQDHTEECLLCTLGNDQGILDMCSKASKRYRVGFYHVLRYHHCDQKK